MRGEKKLPVEEDCRNRIDFLIRVGAKRLTGEMKRAPVESN